MKLWLLEEDNDKLHAVSGGQIPMYESHLSQVLHAGRHVSTHDQLIPNLLVL